MDLVPNQDNLVVLVNLQIAESNHHFLAEVPVFRPQVQVIFSLVPDTPWPPRMWAGMLRRTRNGAHTCRCSVR